MKAAVGEQATNALLAGAMTCIATGVFASESQVMWDAFKMAFGLTVVVPPAILLVGWFIKGA